MAGRKITRAKQADVTVIEPITPQQQQFIEALLAGHTTSEAALMAGISRRTVYYWLQEDNHPVTLEYEKQAAILYQTNRERLKNIRNMAMQVIEDALSAESPIAIRIKVAEFVLSTWVDTERDPSHRTVQDLLGQEQTRANEKQMSDLLGSSLASYLED